MLSQRMLFGSGFLFCTGLMAIALYFEHILELEPCPLCMFQRVFVIGAGIVLLIGALHDPRLWGRRVYGSLIALIAGTGAAVAARHVWLQNLPPEQIPQCGRGLDYMLENYPLSKTLVTILRGSGDCAEVVWSFLGLSIPGWTLIAFCGLTLFGIYLAFSRI